MIFKLILKLLKIVTLNYLINGLNLQLSLLYSTELQLMGSEVPTFTKNVIKKDQR